MYEYPKDIKFKYNWRKYQQRVLAELDGHMSDSHLHIVAPPGSGKTILGLEVAIRLNKPTLILAPSLAIRDQWINRFCDLFLCTDVVPSWISTDIRRPEFMTVVTYQGLHAACHQGTSAMEDTEDDTDTPIPPYTDNLNSIVKGLKEHHIRTFIVDEAHHLKSSWWQTLIEVKRRIDPNIIGLTATPPYDVTPNEWDRYISLNGPIDAEISVPELIKEGDLCPHQDYVHLSLPTPEEYEEIHEFRAKAEMLFREISKDPTLTEAILQQPIWRQPEEHLEWIYNNLTYYAASIIYLNASGLIIPKTHLEIIGDEDINIPPLDHHRMETLLEFYLYRGKEYFSDFHEHQTALEGRLRRYGLIENKQIRFDLGNRLQTTLLSSISKLDSIKEITDFEYQQLGDELRLVILTDYIRKEFYVNATENNLRLAKIGIIPIFEKLRRTNTNGKKIGVLSGSMVIIPTDAYPAFEAQIHTFGALDIDHEYVPYDNEYTLIHQTGAVRKVVLQVMTQLFEEGKIQILIGTKSLLGEGWDAPCINALILASFVGSFVLSNQMRGRAIRTQRGNPSKTGNIWHLLTLDPTATDGGNDFEVLQRRFKGFVGISEQQDGGIENGIHRLNIPRSISRSEDVSRTNEKTFSNAQKRDSLQQRWDKAIERGTTLVEEVKIPFREEKEYKPTKVMYFNKTIANLLATLLSGFASYGLGIMQSIGRSAHRIRSIRDLYIFLAVIGVIGMLYFGRQTIKVFRLYLKYRDISKDIERIGFALLESLIKAGAIKTERSNLDIHTTTDNSGNIYTHLVGGTAYEEAAFINALKEIISPIDNPRYVILRKNKWLKTLNQKDYHAVPEILGRNKKLSEYFMLQWKRRVGDCQLVYTRTIEGHKMLLKARVKALSSQLNDGVEQINMWK